MILNYRIYLLLYHLKTVLRVLLFWVPLGVLRVGAVYCVISFLYARWLPMPTVAHISMVFVPGLMLILVYPFLKSKPENVSVEEYVNLFYAHGVEQRKIDIQRYFQHTIAATATTMLGVLLAVALLRFMLHVDTETLPTEMLSDYFEYHDGDEMELLMETPMLQAGIGYFLGWFATPLFRRVLYGKFESPFCSFRFPLPRKELSAHAGAITDSNLRGKGMSSSGIGGRWLTNEEEEE